MWLAWDLAVDAGQSEGHLGANDTMNQYSVGFRLTPCEILLQSLTRYTARPHYHA